jgi:TetR/AcrR family transcriptional repressor of nem operon
MVAFWTKGYESTSLNDLMAATGLHKGSLYQAFGDKHSLFLESLKRYLARMRQTEHEEFAKAATPAEGLRRVGHSLVDLVDDDSDPPKGCMAVNALVEMAPHDPDVQAIMNDHIGRMRATIEQAVAQAQVGSRDDDEKPNLESRGACAPRCTDGRIVMRAPAIEEPLFFRAIVDQSVIYRSFFAQFLTVQ